MGDNREKGEGRGGERRKEEESKGEEGGGGHNLNPPSLCPLRWLSVFFTALTKYGKWIPERELLTLVKTLFILASAISSLESFGVNCQPKSNAFVLLWKWTLPLSSYVDVAFSSQLQLTLWGNDMMLHVVSIKRKKWQVHGEIWAI